MWRDTRRKCAENKKRRKRDNVLEEWKRDTDSSSTAEGYTAMMSPHAGIVGPRNRLAI